MAIIDWIITVLINQLKIAQFSIFGCTRGEKPVVSILNAFFDVLLNLVALRMLSFLKVHREVNVIHKLVIFLVQIPVLRRCLRLSVLPA